MKHATAAELKELKKRNALYEAILDRVLQGIYVLDKDENIVWLNDQIATLDRVNRDELIGKKDSAISQWKINNRNESDLAYTFRTGKQSKNHLTSWFNQNTGQMMHIYSQAFPFFYEQRLEYIYSLGYYLEYTEKQLHKISTVHKQITNQKQRSPYYASFTLHDVIGNSSKIQNLVAMARRVAVNHSPILIYGKTGTGKEVFAQGIHNASLKNYGPFVAINCAAIPENLIETTLFGSVKGAFTGAVTKAGLLEEANDGTLFLDELDSLPMSTQGKLLRVLQERKANRVGDNIPYSFNCRFISATNQEPRKLIEDGILRSDLYYRLSVINLEIPPLIQRNKDIEELTLFFISKFNKEYRLKVSLVDSQVFSAFHRHDWPGNVRELQHVIEYMMNFINDRDDTLSADYLPAYLKWQDSQTYAEEENIFEKKDSYKNLMRYMEKRILEAALKRNRWNITQTAKELEMSRETLHYHINKLALSRNS